jgi:hypothetical protein
MPYFASITAFIRSHVSFRTAIVFDDKEKFCFCRQLKNFTL